MINENTIKEVKSLNIVDVISQYVKLKKSGNQYVGNCPFHDEKTPSFYVHPSKGYHCFGCNEKGSNVVDFIMNYEGKIFVESVEQLAGMYGIIIDDNVLAKPIIHKKKPIQTTECKEADYIPDELLTVNLTAYSHSNLYKFFVGLFGVEKANTVCLKYGIGSYNYYGSGTTLFAQRDISGNYRQIKVIPYDPATGHRIKSKQPRIIGRFIDSSMRNKNLIQCFFGEHLLKENDLPVAIVESEKTAAICSIHYPKYLWLATGGKNGCNMRNPNINKVLIGKNIHLFPDVDGVGEWKETANELSQQGYKVFVNDVMANYPDMIGSKADIADLLVNVPVWDVPNWYISAKGILERYEQGEITGDGYLDMIQKNADDSALSYPDYVKQINKYDTLN